LNAGAMELRVRKTYKRYVQMNITLKKGRFEDE